MTYSVVWCRLPLKHFCRSFCEKQSCLRQIHRSYTVSNHSVVLKIGLHYN